MSSAVSRRSFDLAILLVVSVTLASVVGRVIHFSAPGASARMQVLKDVIAGRSIAYTPYPVGYYEFAGYAMRWSPAHGLAAAQGALYVLTVLLAWSILRQLGARSSAPLIGALIVACYPNLLLTIPRFQDTCISCFFMVFFTWLVVRFKQQGISPANAAIAGILFGCMLLVRSNALTIVPIALWAAFYGREITAKQIALTTASVALTLAVLAAVNIPAKGNMSIFDRYYGAYAFAANTHQHALEGVLHDYNGEMRMPAAYQELGLPAKGLETRDDALADEYMTTAWRFIKEHPFQYIILEFAKVLNIFRPDLRNSEKSFVPPFIACSVQIAIASIFFVWCFLRWRSGTLTTLNEGFFIIPLLLLYFVPFIPTASDPRYRFAIDSLLIIDSVLCLQRPSAARRAASESRGVSSS